MCVVFVCACAFVSCFQALMTEVSVVNKCPVDVQTSYCISESELQLRKFLVIHQIDGWFLFTKREMFDRVSRSVQLCWLGLIRSPSTRKFCRSSSCATMLIKSSHPLSVFRIQVDLSE